MNDCIVMYTFGPLGSWSESIESILFSSTCGDINALFRTNSNQLKSNSVSVMTLFITYCCCFYFWIDV
jgi:hypothetical protein